MRIAINMATARGAGSGQVGRNILREIVAAGAEHEFLVWTPNSWGRDGQELLDGHSTHCKLSPSRPGALAKLVRENVAMRLRVATWMADRLFTTVETSFVGCRVPNLVLVQQAYLAYDPADYGFVPPARLRAKLALNQTYFRANLPTATHFTVQIEDMKQHLAARWQIPEDRITVVPSSINPALYAARRDALNASARVSGRPYLCVVATPIRHKNLQVLPEIIANLAPSHPGLTCRVTATRAQSAELLARAEEARVADRLECVGALPHDRTLSLLRGAAATIIPSRLESFGITYYEAMALGVPIVAADRGFAREACGDAALYANPDAPEEFAEHLRKILDSPTLARQMRERGVRRLEQVYVSWQEIARRYLHLLEALTQ